AGHQPFHAKNAVDVGDSVPTTCTSSTHDPHARQQPHYREQRPPQLVIMQNPFSSPEFDATREQLTREQQAAVTE
ncbi:unnamed protein product, partial [Amoebophrya sp. A25]